LFFDRKNRTEKGGRERESEEMGSKAQYKNMGFYFGPVNKDWAGLALHIGLILLASVKVLPVQFML
jgi:hypothetical protein